MKNSMALGGLALVMSLLAGTASLPATAATAPVQAAAAPSTELLAAVAFDRQQWLDAPTLADGGSSDALRLKCSFNSKSMFKMRRAQCRMV